ncbi:hypothetical protein AAIH00_35445, partial [Pseudomonas aeruginosa]
MNLFTAETSRCFTDQTVNFFITQRTSITNRCCYAIPKLFFTARNTGNTPLARLPDDRRTVDGQLLEIQQRFQ